MRLETIVCMYMHMIVCVCVCVFAYVLAGKMCQCVEDARVGGAEDVRPRPRYKTFKVFSIH